MTSKCHSPTHCFSKGISGWWNSTKGHIYLFVTFCPRVACAETLVSIPRKRLEVQHEYVFEGLHSKKKLFLLNQQSFVRYQTSTTDQEVNKITDKKRKRVTIELLLSDPCTDIPVGHYFTVGDSSTDDE